MPESVDIPSTDKIADVDLSKQGVGIDISSGEYYTGRLYTPDDFAKGDISQGNPDDKYATFRIVLPLEKGVTYGLSGETATYAQQVYIDGKLLSEVGKVSDNAEEFVPATDQIHVIFYRTGGYCGDNNPSRMVQSQDRHDTKAVPCRSSAYIRK